MLGGDASKTAIPEWTQALGHPFPLFKEKPNWRVD